MQHDEETDDLIRRIDQRDARVALDPHLNEHLVLGERPLDIFLVHAEIPPDNVGARSVFEVVREVLAELSVRPHRDGCDLARRVGVHFSHEGVVDLEGFGEVLYERLEEGLARLGREARRQLAQGRLDPLAFGDVGRDTADCVDLALRVDQRRSHRDVSVQAVILRYLFFPLQGLSGFEDLAIMRAELVRLLLLEHIVVRLADNVVATDVEQLFVTPVDSQVTSLGVLDRYHGG